ncbi:hypothetical protein NP233_g1716 [Leucocoprinus birnbaumii]|uniref:Uncharacterized protein n=1 Tax=Leucocoprinus birnbaumii TaxID=56174 RepID=A0AAD5W029_9AGAR|nr:hypothetical protein NP233_g1716 [Leucocoprinus birnbaumii]
MFSSFAKSIKVDRSPVLNGDTIVDEPAETQISTIDAVLGPRSCSDSVSLALPPKVHISETNYDHMMLVSPTSSTPPTTFNSRAPSPNLDGVGVCHLSFGSLKWRLASGYFACFVIGWADGGAFFNFPRHKQELNSPKCFSVTGTVMPYLDAEFHLTTRTSSLLWAGTTCGFFIGTFLLEIILRWLGRFNHEASRKRIIPHSLVIFNKNASSCGHSATQARHSALLIASIMHAFYFIMMGSRGGFPVMFIAYAMAAFARALLTALLNAYFAAGPKQALGFGYGIASE